MWIIKTFQLAGKIAQMELEYKWDFRHFIIFAEKGPGDGIVELQKVLTGVCFFGAGAVQTAVFLQNFTDQEYFMRCGKVFQPGGANFEQHYLEVTPEMLAALFPGKVVPA